MGFVAKLVGFFKALVIPTVLLSALVFINVLQTMSLLLRPLSDKAFRSFNRSLAGLWWGWCAMTAERINGIRFHFLGDPLPVSENAIVLVNHQEMTDILVMLSVAKAQRTLGDLKWFVKDELKYVPGIGWGMLFLDCLFVKRNWTEDRDMIQKTFERLLKHEIPVWLMIFPEGTRMTPSKLQSSKDFAARQGLQPLRHLLIPRSKGFVASAQSLRTHVAAVYDLTIGYVDGSPSLSQWISGQVRHVNVFARRFPMDTLPTDAEALSDWLMDRYRVKDDMIDAYLQTGTLSDPTA